MAHNLTHHLSRTSHVLTLLGMLIGWAGCSDRRVIVSIQDWADSTARLYVSASIGGNSGKPIILTKEQTKFLIHLPNGQDGWLTLNAATLADDDSKTAVATTSLLIDAGTKFPAEASLKLCALSSPTKAAWVPYCNPSDAEVNIVHGTNPNDIYAISNQVVPEQKHAILHWDGASWAKLGDPKIQFVIRAWASRPNDVWISGFFGQVMHYDGYAWMAMNPGGEAGISNTGSYYGLWGSSESDVWAAGNLGYVLHWNGTRWNHATHVSIPSKYLGWIWQDSNGIVWNVGSTSESAGQVYSFDNNQMYPMIDLQKLTGISKKLNHITGIGGTMMVAADGGFAFLFRDGSWQRIDTGLVTNYLGGQMFSANDAWLVGENGIIARWNGERFVQSSTSSTDALKSIWGSSSHDLWAVGSGATHRIFRFIP